MKTGKKLFGAVSAVIPSIIVFLLLNIGIMPSALALQVYEIVYGGTASADVCLLPDYCAEKAFDGNWGTGWWGYRDNYLKYTLDSAEAVTKYRLLSSGTPSGAGTPKAWDFEGSNDGVSWIRLNTRINQTGWVGYTWRDFFFDNDIAYKHYRIRITDVVPTDAGGYYLEIVSIPEMQLYTSKEQVTAGISALPEVIEPGGTATLSWNTTHAGNVTIEPAIGSNIVDPVGTASVSPDATTLYTITATGPGGPATARATVKVEIPRQLELVTNIQAASAIDNCTSPGFCPEEAYDGDLSTYWMGFMVPENPFWLQYTLSSSEIVTKYRLLTSVADLLPKAWFFQGSNDGVNWQDLDFRFNQNGYPGAWQEFTFENTIAYRHYRINITDAEIWCDYGGGCWSTVQINEMQLYTLAPIPPPTASISASPDHIDLGHSTTLSWSTTHATAVTVDPEIGSTNFSGTQTVSPTSTTTYTITAYGDGGTATQSVTVPVADHCSGSLWQRWITSWQTSCTVQGPLSGMTICDDTMTTQGTTWVETSGNALLVATNRIVLQPGFTVKTGAAFSAHLSSRFTDNDPVTGADGLPDCWELAHFGTLAYGPNDDPDADGLTNMEEFLFHTAPANCDSDGDKLLDAWEIWYGLDPLYSQDAFLDPDADGVCNLGEFIAGSDPTSAPTGEIYQFNYDETGNLKDVE